MKETIIAQPLNKDHFASEKDYKEKLLTLEHTLTQVKEVLNEMDELFHSKVADDKKKPFDKDYVDPFYQSIGVDDGYDPYGYGDYGYGYGHAQTQFKEIQEKL